MLKYDIAEHAYIKNQEVLEFWRQRDTEKQNIRVILELIHGSMINQSINQSKFFLECPSNINHFRNHCR